jgi:hypothetical protein
LESQHGEGKEEGQEESQQEEIGLNSAVAQVAAESNPQDCARSSEAGTVVSDAANRAGDA